ncbi:MAG: GNAT family N-acetyltransferase [Saprospiraceae bacterium]|nr:GNAT family N-acetyltransferase [Saprospiraceae bacterium]
MLQYSCTPFSSLSLAALYEVMAVRQLIFAVEQDCAYLDADGKDITAWHVLGTNGQGEILTYARLLPKGIAYEDYASIGRVLSMKAVRGSGEGRRLMEFCLAQCDALWPGISIKISAQAYLLEFYASLGFAPVGESYLEDGIPHRGMIRKTPVPVK